jgi:quercetin dioxygenase-like cupin family protein
MFQPPLSIGSRLARRATRLTPGGRYAIPPNTAHRISNGGDGEDCQFLLLQGVGVYDFKKITE